MADTLSYEKPKARRFIRHWKERFTPGMPLIFIRDVRLDAERMMKAGDPVTPELREELGEHRMKMWWTAKRVGCAKMAVVPLIPPPPLKGATVLKSKQTVSGSTKPKT